jgi:arylsulfatase A-like enzyme/lysophospholipase L1-like esterase
MDTNEHELIARATREVRGKISKDSVLSGAARRPHNSVVLSRHLAYFAGNPPFSFVFIRVHSWFKAAFLLIACLLGNSFACAGNPTKPNIVVLIADDLGVGDLGFSGAKDIPTPNLDRLAAEGVIFRNGYATPMCAPTRVAFLTGRSPAKIGFEDNRPGDSLHFGMDLSLPTVANVLHDAGYVTGLIGKWHVGRGLNHEYSPWKRGFDEFLGYYGAFGTYVNPKLTEPPGVEKTVQGYSTEIFADAACAFIEKHKEKPFFLNVAFNAAHLQQVAKEEDLAKFQHIADPKRRTAAAIISNLDANVGKIAARLKAEGLDQNTLLFFFSDNGGEPPILGTLNGPFRGMKFDVYEGGIHVPFFVRWPGRLKAGKTDALVSVMDLLPTVAVAGGGTVPGGIDGVDLLPYLSKKSSKEPHEDLFWRTTEHAALQKLRKQTNGAPVQIPHLSAVREGKWKLVALDDVGKEPKFELYNLNKDISERNDLSAKEPKVLAHLKQKLDDWRATLKPQVIPPARPKVAQEKPVLAPVVCLGDSITHAGYPAELEKMLHVPVINAGVPGNTSRQGLARLERDVLSHKPKVVVVVFATNDNRQDAPRVHVSLPEFEKNLTTIIERCHRIGAEVLLGTIPPVDPEPYFTRHVKADFDAAGGLEKLVEQYRAATWHVGETQKVPVVDLTRLLAKDVSWRKPDGVHPTDDGNRVIAQAVLEPVKKLLGK